MQALTINEEQKAKLLEMAKFFFPEYDRLSVDDIQTDVDDFTVMVVLCKTNPNYNINNLGYPSEGKSIHWFEFVLCHLYFKIKNFGTMMGDVTWAFTLQPTHCQYIGHPVDYLYNIFKNTTSNG